MTTFIRRHPILIVLSVLLICVLLYWWWAASSKPTPAPESAAVATKTNQKSLDDGLAAVRLEVNKGMTDMEVRLSKQLKEDLEEQKRHFDAELQRQRVSIPKRSIPGPSSKETTHTETITERPGGTLVGDIAKSRERRPPQ